MTARLEFTVVTISFEAAVAKCSHWIWNGNTSAYLYLTFKHNHWKHFRSFLPKRAVWRAKKYFEFRVSVLRPLCWKNSYKIPWFSFEEPSFSSYMLYKDKKSHARVVKWLIVKVKANRLHTYRKSPAWKKCLVFCKLSTKNNHKWSQIRFPCLFSLTEKGWDIISRDLTPSEKFQWISSILFDINRVFLLGLPWVCFVRNPP